MGSLHTISAPAPALYVTGARPAVPNAYFAVTVDAAVDLSQASEYKYLPPRERLSKARAEQRGFLNGFSDPALGMALDLRVAADPAASTPLSAAVLGRVWGNGAAEVARRAGSLRTLVHEAMPPHVTATAVEQADEVARLLSPFAGAVADSAVITRHELIAAPARPDAGVSYYYSAVPFNWADSDWSAVYAALEGSPVPVVLSVAVLPLKVPAQFSQTLMTLADFYGRLARAGEPPGGLYYQGSPRLAPDPFAVEAERDFRDFARRLSRKAFALRIQVSAAKRLPPGLVEAIAAAITPGPDGGPPQRAACDARHPASAAERRLAEYNLSVINFGMLTGRPEIWGRPDPPDPQLAMLSVLGDARDAACAFRFPVAVDGVVPGFPVRREVPSLAAGRAVTREVTGPEIRLGRASGAGEDVTVPLRSLAGHTLITGAAGSGKTTTVLELLRQLWAEHGIPFLVLDPASPGPGDYRKLAAEPRFGSLEVLTAGDEGGAPLRFNPFEVPAGTLVGEHAANLLTCFQAAFGLAGPLPSVYRDALSLTYLRSGFLSAERSAGGSRAWPTVADFAAAAAEVTAGRGYEGRVRADVEAASVQRARQLVRGVAGSVFLTDRPGGPARLLDRPVIVELRALGAGEERALVTALLLNAVTEHYRAGGAASPELVHVTVVEEARGLLTRAPGREPARDDLARERAAALLAGALAENRKYGAGVIITERLPARLLGEVTGSAGLKVMHRLPPGAGQRHLARAAGLDEAQLQFAGRLPAGEALVAGDAFPEAARVSVTRTIRAGDPGAPAAQPAAQPAATAPFRACEPCRAQCAYRGAALSVLDDPAAVTAVTGAAGPPAGQQAGLARLSAALREAVGAFAALPATGPERDDAAFCFFLHVYASGGSRGGLATPAAVARSLEIAAPGDEPR